MAASFRKLYPAVGQLPVSASPAKAFFTKGVESASEPLTAPEWSRSG